MPQVSQNCGHWNGHKAMPSSEESCLRSREFPPVKWGITKQMMFFQSSEQTPMDPGPSITAGVDPHLQTSPAPPDCRAHPDEAEAVSWQCGAALMLIKSTPSRHSPPDPPGAQAWSRGSLGQRAGKRQLPPLQGCPHVNIGLLNSRCLLLASCSPPVLWTLVTKQIFLPSPP